MAPPKQPHHSPECHTSSSLSAPNSYSIRFPQRSTQGHPLQVEPTGSDAITIKGLRIVVADDDTFTAALIDEALRSHGFEVKTASSIDSEGELIESWDPPAIVSDLNFGPGESGTSLLKRAGELYPWMGLVVLTSHLTPEHAVADAQTLPTGAASSHRVRRHHLDAR